MRKLYDKLLESLNISGRELAVFLLALLLAFSIWLIHNLSLKYNDYLTSTVFAQCNLEGHSPLSINESDIVARCRATGYKVILSDIRAHRKPVTVNFDRSVMKHKEDDLFYVVSSDLTEYAHLIYGDGVTLDYFVSDTVFFRFPEVDHKKVPVHPVYSVSYLPQHMSNGQLEVIPDSVTVYGEAYRLESIDKVFTEMVKYTSLSSDIQGVVRLEKIRGVRLSVDEVHYLLDVTRYVEISRSLPVKVINVPADKKLQVFPAAVTVLAKFAFPLSGAAHEEMEVVVDYEDFISSISGKCPVRLSGLPSGLISYEMNPVAVNCVLEER